MHEDGIKKLYYSIGEVSEMTDLEQHVLRYWESEFDQLQPRKNRAGRRAYTEDDIQTVRRIQHLLKEEKYTIEGARQVLDRGDVDALPESKREEFVEMRRFLRELLDTLESD